MSSATLLVIYGLMRVSLSTINSLCVKGSHYDGTYEYNTYVSDPSGYVWFNRNNEQFLYPYNVSTWVGWGIGDSYKIASGPVFCHAEAPSMSLLHSYDHHQCINTIPHRF